MGPQKELPTRSQAKPAPPRVRGSMRPKAIMHARCSLNRTNLRARLGHAYALDRLGRIGDAREELRRLVKLGLPRLQEARSEWGRSRGPDGDRRPSQPSRNVWERSARCRQIAHPPPRQSADDLCDADRRAADGGRVRYADERRLLRGVRFRRHRRCARARLAHAGRRMAGLGPKRPRAISARAST